jgi:hypothetical protein
MLRALEMEDTQISMSSVEGRVTMTISGVLQSVPQYIPPSIDFFSLGGDSLTAGKLTAALRAEFGTYVPYYFPKIFSV